MILETTHMHHGLTTSLSTMVPRKPSMFMKHNLWLAQFAEQLHVVLYWKDWICNILCSDEHVVELWWFTSEIQNSFDFIENSLFYYYLCVLSYCYNLFICQYWYSWLHADLSPNRAWVWFLSVLGQGFLWCFFLTFWYLATTRVISTVKIIRHEHRDLLKLTWYMCVLLIVVQHRCTYMIRSVTLVSEEHMSQKLATRRKGVKYLHLCHMLTKCNSHTMTDNSVLCGIRSYTVYVDPAI